MSTTRYSVALCTYNGARFLDQQLASIAAQTRPPDELVVSDDASTDNTVELVEAFRRRATFPVRLFVQPFNLGSAKNFEHALGQCTGELIALSDQDDIWFPHRLQASEEYMQRHFSAAFVFTDGIVIDAAGRPLGHTLWQAFHFDQPLQAAITAGDYSVLLRHRFITGATITLRAEALPRILPFPASWVHDEWLATVTPFFAEIGMLGQELLQYRVHTTQQVGAQRVRSYSSASHWANIDRQRTQMVDLLAHLEQHPPVRHPDLVTAYRERAAALARRAALPSSSFQRIARVTRNYSDYRLHGAGILSAVKDILLAKPA
jgi:glycosyltransferase involved in cell wall biosynthesis